MNNKGLAKKLTKRPGNLIQEIFLDLSIFSRGLPDQRNMGDQQMWLQNK